MNRGWVDQWLSDKTAHSQRAYRADLNSFETWAGKPPWEATREDLEKFSVFLLETGKADGTMRRAVASVGSLVNAVDAEKNPPKRGLRMDRIAMREIQPPDASILDAVWKSNLNVEYRLSWFLCWRLGLKSSEATSMVWSDFDLESGLFRVGARSIRLSPQCKRFLAQFNDRSGIVLVGRDGNLCHTQLLRRIQRIGACIGRPDITPR